MHHLTSHSYCMQFKPQLTITPPVLSPLIDHSPIQTLQTLPTTMDSFPYIRGVLPRGDPIDELNTKPSPHAHHPTPHPVMDTPIPKTHDIMDTNDDTEPPIQSGESVHHSHPHPPPNMIAISDASDSEQSMYRGKEDMDHIDVRNSLSDHDQLLYNKYIFKYDDDDGYSDNYNDTRVVLSTTDSTSFDSHNGHLQDDEPSTSLTNNNATNNDDSDVIDADNNSFHSGCPIYHDEDVYRQNPAFLCDDERSVFELFQNKLMEMDDFSRDYMDLRNNYLLQQCTVEKNRQINLTRTKQKIGECFDELYVLLKEKENALLFEVDEMYKAQTVTNTSIDLKEKQTNNELQKALSEHVAYISHQITLYQATSALYDLSERKKLIVKVGEDIQSEHRSRITYFNSMYDQMKANLEGLNDEKHIDFVLDDNIHFDCCNFLRCNEFGRVVSNIPKPAINHIQILGNDILHVELSENAPIDCHTYKVLSYQISYGYHSTIHVENVDEKQDKMQWENVEIDCCAQHNVYLIEFEIDDLNLVNADLIIKIRYLLKQEEESMKLWTQWSDIYQLTQADLYKSMRNIVACLDEDDCDDEDESSSSSSQPTIPHVNEITPGDDSHDTAISPLFALKPSDRDASSECNTAQTVCYKQEFEDEIGVTPDTECNTVHEHSDCTVDDEEESNTDHDESDEDMERDADVIDMVKFQKDLYFDQNEIEMQMTQNQQLIQQFMKGISNASKVNNELITSIKRSHKQRELWMNNQCDIIHMKRSNRGRRKSKLPLLTSGHSWMKGSSKASSISTNLSSSTSTSTSSESSFKFTHSFNAQSLPPSLNTKTKRPSITRQIVTKISKIGQKLTNRASNHTHHSHHAIPNDLEHHVAWNQRIAIYGELCHILQENPVYLSRLTRVIQVRDIPLWCRTVICDLFGNQSDTRNEHLLLRVFECIVKDYCVDCTDMNVFLRGDNIITRMITCFMNDRCADNMKTLQFIFERPMKELIFDNEQQLNLEIDPLKVYNDGIDVNHHHATESTLISDSCNSSNSNPMLKVDSLNSDSLHSSTINGEYDENVKTIIARRMEQIQVIVAFFLDRMSENARVIPFGIRWLCKIVFMNAKASFPDATPFELNVLVGQVIYTRFFEPALNAPYEFLNLTGSIAVTPGNVVIKNEVIANNFHIVCRVLRSILCNERFTHSICSTNRTLLHWIKRQQMDRVPVFYEKLLDLPATELKDRLNVDNYLICCKTDLQLSLKQIHLLHGELYRNQEIWSNDYNHNIPLFDVLDRLESEAPYPYKYDTDKVVVLDLTVIETSFNPFFVDNHNSNSEYSLNTLNQTDSGFVNVQYNENDSYHQNEGSMSDIELNMDPLEHDAHVSELKCDDEQLISNDESYIYNILFSIKYKDDDIMGIRHSLRQLLIDKSVPQCIVADYRHSLKQLLTELRGWSAVHAHDQETMLSLIDSIVERMDAYLLKHNLSGGYNSFVAGYHCDIKKIVHFSKRLELKAMTFAKARDVMMDHTHYLEDKLAEYKQLVQEETAMVKPCKGIKISYKNLLNQNIMVDDEDNAHLRMNRHLVFHFVHESMDCFEVEIVCKSKSKKSKNSENESCLEATSLSLVKLLEMRDANHCQFLLQSFAFYVDTTIHFLNGILANK
eukprot:77752_1